MGSLKELELFLSTRTNLALTRTNYTVKVTRRPNQQLTVSPCRRPCAGGEPARFGGWDSARARRTWRSHPGRSRLSSLMQRPSQQWLACGHRSLSRQKTRFMFRQCKKKKKKGICAHSVMQPPTAAKGSVTERCTQFTLIKDLTLSLYSATLQRMQQIQQQASSLHL